MSRATREYHVVADAAPVGVSAVVVLPRPRVAPPETFIAMAPERLRRLRATRTRCIVLPDPGCPPPAYCRSVLAEVESSLIALAANANGGAA